MQNSSFRDGSQYAWDATSVELAQTCMRKYYYRMILGVAPRSTSVHLVFGGIYASALETFYKLRAENIPYEEALRLIVRGALTQSWEHERDSGGKRIPGTGQPVPFDHAAKTRSTLIRSIIWYVEEFGDESDSAVRTHYLADGTPAVELSFALEFADDVIYCGHLDRVIEYAGQLHWMDQKTSGRPINDFFYQQFELHNQFSGYTWAGQIILKSPIKAGIVDGAYITAGYTAFGRGFVTRTKDQIDEWYENTVYTIQWARQLTREKKFPMNLTACGNYGGCPYRELCARSPKVREHYLQSNFKQLPAWSPIEPR